MIHDVAKRTGMQPHSDAYFRQMAEVLFPRKAAGLMYATLEDKPVASLIFFSDGTTMAYAHAASYTAQRNLSPATALVVSALFYAHDTGHKFFDFTALRQTICRRITPGRALHTSRSRLVAHRWITSAPGRNPSIHCATGCITSTKRCINMCVVCAKHRIVARINSSWWGYSEKDALVGRLFILSFPFPTLLM